MAAKASPRLAASAARRRRGSSMSFGHLCALAPERAVFDNAEPQGALSGEVADPDEEVNVGECRGLSSFGQGRAATFLGDQLSAPGIR